MRFNPGVVLAAFAAGALVGIGGTLALNGSRAVAEPAAAMTSKPAARSFAELAAAPLPALKPVAAAQVVHPAKAAPKHRVHPVRRHTPRATVSLYERSVRARTARRAAALRAAAWAASSFSTSASPRTTATPTARISSPAGSPATGRSRAPSSPTRSATTAACGAGRSSGSRWRGARATTTPGAERVQGRTQMGARDDDAAHRLGAQGSIGTSRRRRPTTSSLRGTGRSIARATSFGASATRTPAICSTTTARSTGESAASGTPAGVLRHLGHEIRARDPGDLQPCDGEAVGRARAHRPSPVPPAREVRRRDDDAHVRESRHEAARCAQGSRARAREPERRDCGRCTGDAHEHRRGRVAKRQIRRMRTASAARCSRCRRRPSPPGRRAASARSRAARRARRGR